jgi:hypothetical protein
MNNAFVHRADADQVMPEHPQSCIEHEADHHFPLSIVPTFVARHNKRGGFLQNKMWGIGVIFRNLIGDLQIVSGAFGSKKKARRKARRAFWQGLLCP